MILVNPGTGGPKFTYAQRFSRTSTWRSHVVRHIHTSPRRQFFTNYLSHHALIQEENDVSSDALRKGIVEYGSSYEDDTEDDISAGARSAACPTVSTATYECVRIIPKGRATKLYLKRRDLLRSFALAPRDLRRIDPNLSFTRSSPVLTIKDNVLLVQLSGVRLIITAQSALLLDPRCRAARQYLEQIVPRLQVSAGQRYMQEVSSTSSIDETGGGSLTQELPFELEMLEAALNLAVGKLDNELVRAQERVQLCLQKLPRDISPANLDDLRRIKGTLVELESASDAYREMLEDIMDDETELREVNLSSRVARELRQRARERERLEREMAREREEQESRRKEGGSSPPAYAARNGIGADSRDVPGFSGNAKAMDVVDPLMDRSPRGTRPRPYASRSRIPPGLPGVSPSALNKSTWNKAAVLQDMSRVQQDVLRGYSVADVHGGGQDHRANARTNGATPTYPNEDTGSSSDSTDEDDNPSGALDYHSPHTKSANGRQRDEATFYNFDGDVYSTATQAEVINNDPMSPYQEYPARSRGRIAAQQGNEEFRNQVSAPSMDYWHDVGTLDLSMDSEGYLAQMVESEAQMELREMEEAEEEEQELQEVEDLFEFYLQRATSIQTEAERLLAGARDLEESIGLALSARRYEVNRLELQLSIGGFAAALGAMFAGIFGMNLRSTLEESVLGFWGTTFAIVAGCVWVYVAIMRWTKARKIFN